MTVRAKISPSCSQCGTQMLLVRIFADTPGYERRTYECSWCPHERTEIVRSVFSPTSGHATGRDEKVVSAQPEEPARIQMIQLVISDSA